MKRFGILPLLLIALVAPAAAKTHKPVAMQIVTPAYTLTCVSRTKREGVVLSCVPAHTPKRVQQNLFAQWRYGDPMPRALFVDTAPLGNGSPTLCDTTTILCGNGVVGLALGNANTWTALQTFPDIADTALSVTAGTLVCSTGATQKLTTAGCTTGGGDTITSPNSTLTVGGTATASTLDLNLATANAWTGLLTNTAQIQALGAGGANACAGSKYPTQAYGLCIGANNGTTNLIGLVLGPQQTTFACTATCTAGDSTRIRFYDSLSSGANSCDFFMSQGFAALDSGCNFYVSGTLQAENNSSSTRSYVAPTYTVTGTAQGSNMHGIIYSCTFAAATTCAVTVSGTGNTFGGATSYTCPKPDMGTATTYLDFTIGNKTTTGFTIYASASNSDTVYGYCIGT